MSCSHLIIIMPVHHCCTNSHLIRGTTAGKDHIFSQQSLTNPICVSHALRRINSPPLAAKICMSYIKVHKLEQVRNKLCHRRSSFSLGKVFLKALKGGLPLPVYCSIDSHFKHQCTSGQYIKTSCRR